MAQLYALQGTHFNYEDKDRKDKEERMAKGIPCKH